jgi:hypothetical protein
MSESVRDIALKIATGQAFVDEDAVRLAEAWLSERGAVEKAEGSTVEVRPPRSESDEEAA